MTNTLPDPTEKSLAAVVPKYVQNGRLGETARCQSIELFAEGSIEDGLYPSDPVGVLSTIDYQFSSEDELTFGWAERVPPVRTDRS